MDYKIIPNRNGDINKLLKTEVNKFIHSLYNTQESSLISFLENIDKSIEITKSKDMHCNPVYLNSSTIYKIITSVYHFLNSNDIFITNCYEGYKDNTVIISKTTQSKNGIYIFHVASIQEDSDILEVGFNFNGSMFDNQYVLITDKYLYDLYCNTLKRIKLNCPKYQNLKIEGHSNTWYAFSEKEILGKTYLFLENEEHGDETYHIIYNYTDNKVITTGQGISWLDLQDRLIDEVTYEIINKIRE